MKPTLDEHLKGITQGIKPPEGDSETLTLADLSSSAALRPANRQLTRLHVLKADGKVHSFIYNHLDSNTVFDGDHFTLLFVGAKHWEVKVKGHGPKLWTIYDYITLFRWPFLREETGSMPGAGKGDDETVFVEITIKDVTPKAEA